MNILKRRSLKLTSAFLVLCILTTFCVFEAEAYTEELSDFTVSEEYSAPEILSPCAFVMEMNTGTILYSKNADEPHAPASTIKSLTALVAIETAELSDTVTFSESAIYDIEEGGENEDMRVGETMSLESCLKIMMMASCNEAAYCVAEHISGSLSGFAELMNARARSIGAVNSNFKNPHGLTDIEQYTTARDLAMIFAECVKNPVFMEIASLESTCVTDTSIKSYGYVYANHDKMMQPDSVYYRDYVRCGKTGFITQAGNTLVTYASQDGMDIICAILQGESYDNVYNDTIALCDYAFGNFAAVRTDELLEGQIESIIGDSKIVCDTPVVLLPNWLGTEDMSVMFDGMAKGSDAVFTGEASVRVGDNVYAVGFTASPIIDYTIDIPEPAEVNVPSPLPVPSLDSAEPDDEICETEEESEPLVITLCVLLGCFAAAVVVLSILLCRERRKIMRTSKAAEK